MGASRAPPVDQNAIRSVMSERVSEGRVGGSCRIPDTRRPGRPPSGLIGHPNLALPAVRRHPRRPDRCIPPPPTARCVPSSTPSALIRRLPPSQGCSASGRSPTHRPPGRSPAPRSARPTASPEPFSVCQMFRLAPPPDGSARSSAAPGTCRRSTQTKSRDTSPAPAARPRYHGFSALPNPMSPVHSTTVR
jgi:hypothetical protein